MEKNKYYKNKIGTINEQELKAQQIIKFMYSLINNNSDEK
jgi:hypothetical protein